MKTIIAGSRLFGDYDTLCHFVGESGFEITTILCGGAKGADTLGKQWAKERGIAVEEFTAAWGDLEAKGAVIGTLPGGKKYNKRAGLDRNEVMARKAEAAIVFCLRESRGAEAHMIGEAEALGLRLFVVTDDMIEQHDAERQASDNLMEKVREDSDLSYTLLILGKAGGFSAEEMFQKLWDSIGDDPLGVIEDASGDEKFSSWGDFVKKVFPLAKDPSQFFDLARELERAQCGVNRVVLLKYAANMIELSGIYLDRQKFGQAQMF